MIDRSIQPETQDIEEIKFLYPKQSKFTNGIPFYYIQGGTEEVVKINFLFEAGTLFQSKNLIASITNYSLLEGSKNMTSMEINEKLDYYGSFIKQYTDKDIAYVTLYSLNKHLEQSLEILQEVIKWPVFPEREINLILQNKKQQFLVDMEKVKNYGKLQFQKEVYGKDHPYGKVASAEHFDQVSSSDLQSFHQQYYNSANCSILAAGNIGEKEIQLIEKFYGKENWGKENKILRPSLTDIQPKAVHKYIEKENANQSAIWMGKQTIGKNHPDIHGLHILNTTFGGYFGSRLMKNIREDKGYTYGIGSAVVSLLAGSYMVILTETGKKFKDDTLKEIYFEMDRLQNEAIPNEELKLVKSYMQGDLIRMFDGPFAAMDSFQSVYEFGLDYEHYKNYIETIKSITSEDLQALAQKYYDKESIFEIVVG